MQYELNSHYVAPAPKHPDTRSYLEYLILSSEPECHPRACDQEDRFKKIALLSAPADIHYVGASAETGLGLLEVAVILEADNKNAALMKAAGLTLTAMRASGVALPTLNLLDGVLVVGSRPNDTDLLAINPAACDPAYDLAESQKMAIGGIQSRLAHDARDGTTALQV